MNKGGILERPAVIDTTVKVQPRLTDLFVPCPLCRGTIDVETNGRVVCCSCGGEWNLRGEPLGFHKQ